MAAATIPVSAPPPAAPFPFVPVVGPSPYESAHASLVTQLTSATDEIGRLTALCADLQPRLEQVTNKRKAWIEAETARLIREEEERRAREEKERQEREERERIEREERERKEREEREERERKEREEREEKERQRLEAERVQRLEQERKEREEREAAERAAQQAEKERLQREWAEKEKAETAQREEAERREVERREREAALAAAASGAAAGQAGSAVPRELRLRCEALYDLDGDASNDELSFSTGETFLVSGEMNGWMSARSEKTGKVGLVPSNYLRVLEELEPPAAVAAAATVDSSSSGSASVAGAQDAAVTDRKGELVVALFDFSGENDDELSFSTGDRLYKTGEVNGWYIGTHEKGDKVGIFPSNFVEVLAESAAASAAAPTPLADKVVEEKTAFTSSSQSYSAAADDDVPLQAAPDVRRTKSTAFAAAEVASLAQAAQEANAPSTPRSSGVTSPAFSSPATSSSVASVEHDAIALYRFTATSSDQLSFEKGAKLIIRNARLNGWYVGAVLGKDGPGPLGIFPANYVQRVERDQPGTAAGPGAAGKGVEEQKQADDEERSYRYRQQRLSGGSDASAAIPTSVSSPSLSSPSGSAVSSSAPIIGRVTALYDFESTTAENLSFHRGDEIAVVKEIKGWWAGFMVGKDKLGLVPSNYCSPFRPEPAGAVSTMNSSSSSSANAAPLPSQLVGGEWRPATANGVVVTSVASTSDGVSASSSGSSTPSRVSVSSTPPPLSAKPVLLSSLAMSNAVSKGTVQPVVTVLPSSSMPNSISVSPVPAVNASSASSTAAPLASSSVTAASSSSSMSSAAPVSVSAVPVSQQYPTVMAGPGYSSSGWSNNAPAAAAVPPPATAVAAGPSSSYPVVNTMGPPAQPAGFGSTAVHPPPVPVASTAVASPAPVVMMPISTVSSRRSGERLAVAIHDWDTTERGELSFRKDDRLVITKEKQGWYTGYLESAPQRKGMFPSMAVEPVTDASSSSSNAPSASVAPSIAVTASNSPAESAPTTPVSRGRSLSNNSTPSSALQPASASASVTQLERGMVVTKLDTRGRDPKQVRLYLEREKLSRNRRGDWIVRWDTKKFNKREAQVTVARCRVKRGLKRSSADAEPTAFTIIGPSRDLEVICGDSNDREMWIDALMSLSVPLEQALQHDNNAVMQLPPQQPQQQVQVQQMQTVIPQQQQQQQLQPVKAEEEVSLHQILKDGPPASTAGSIPGPASVASAQPLPQAAAPAVRDGSNYAGHLATALYDFGSEKEDLVIVAGDRIELTEAEAGNQWWHGRNVTRGGGKLGMFPASYVQLDANPSSVKTVTVIAPTASPGVTIAPNANSGMVSVPASVPVSGSSPAQPAVKAKAMYDFDTNGAEFPDDLPFKRNDILTLISYGKDMEWWTGVDSRGKKGIFPATFVAIIG